MTDTPKVAAWERRLRAFPQPFDGVLPDRAALWSGWRYPAEVREIARRRGLTTLEATPLGRELNEGTLKRQLDSDFGPDWGPGKKAVWMTVSRMFAGAARGNLTVLLNVERYGDGGTIFGKANPESIVFSEIMETDFGDPRLAFPLVTDIYLWLVNGDSIHTASMMFSAPLQ